VNTSSASDCLAFYLASSISFVLLFDYDLDVVAVGEGHLKMVWPDIPVGAVGVSFFFIDGELVELTGVELFKLTIGELLELLPAATIFFIFF